MLSDEESRIKCQGKRIRAEILDNAVMNTIWESVYDEAGYEEAIKDSMPDSNMISDLMDEISLVPTLERGNEYV